MLPEDTDWHEDSGNEPISHDFVNALELGVDVKQASENAAAIFPVQTGTTLLWGGAKLLFGRSPVINAGADWIMDDTIDWRNRWIMHLDVAVDADEADIPAEAGYTTAAGTHDVDAQDQAACAFWTGAGAAAGSPPVGNYLAPIGGGCIYCNSADNKLTWRNQSVGAYYVFVVLLVSDQFKTRLP